MKLRIDKEAGALFLGLCESETSGTEEVASGVILHYNKDKEVVGIEVLYLDQEFRKADLETLELKTN